MSKYLLLTILLLLIAIPVSADVPYKLIVNDVVVDKPIIIKDGVSYVPVRAIADMFGAKTDWDEATKTISITNITRPPIEGDKEFIEKINAALDLLEEKDFPHYVMVVQYTSRIKKAAVRPHDTSPKSIASANTAHETVIHPELVANKDWYTPLFLAGILVHEGSHHVTFRHNGTTNEDDAKAHQRAAYELLKSPQWMIDIWR